MSDNKFQHQYRIPSARHPWHDYNGGLYFITICTKSMEHYFGEIHNGEMTLNDLGKHATENLENIQQHYPYAEIPLFVIMPNHIHLIVAIVETVCTPSQSQNETTNTNKQTDCTSSVSECNTPDVETGCTPSLQNQQRWKNETVDEQMQLISQKKGWLSVVIGGFKSAITRYANQNNITFAWQTRFHDRIIRDQNECNRIADYIENNPINWKNDEFNQ